MTQIANRVVRTKSHITIALAAFAFASSLAVAGPIAVIPGPADLLPIGPHVRLFSVEKSENPQNILVAFAKLSDTCLFAPVGGDDADLVLDYYWLMDRTQYKPVHRLIKSGIRSRLAVSGKPGGNSFELQLHDLSELQHDIARPRLNVSARRPGRGSSVSHRCDVESTIRLGPSDQSRILRLQSIYSESRKTVVPPFRKVVSVTLFGTDVQSGAAVARKYVAK